MLVFVLINILDQRKDHHADQEQYALLYRIHHDIFASFFSCSMAWITLS